MAEAKVGDKVKILYTGFLEDGTALGSSPLEVEFTIGERSVLPGFEDEVIGMNEGDKKRFSLTPDDAFGHRREDMVFNIERSQLPPTIDLEAGKAVHIDDNNVKLDGNHPLAGKTLSFSMELVEIS